MKPLRLLSALAFAVLSVPSLFAQSNPGTILQLEFQTPKNGMIQQYEDGRKQKAAWHKQQNDKTPLLVWQIISGEDTNTYIVGEPPQHWADMDKPSVPEEADLAEYNKVIGNYVEKLVIRFYEYMPKLSAPPDSKLPLKYSEVMTFHVKYGKESDLRNAVTRVREAAAKTNWGSKSEWYRLANGGSGTEWVLVLPHENWAGFGDQPNIKPVYEMVKDAFGATEAKSIFDSFTGAVMYQTSSIVQFRPDLSYLPGK
ncbi:MAG: hypothetical protein ABSC64_11705 [Candidatus Korobacteraceae bacterium]